MSSLERDAKPSVFVALSKFRTMKEVQRSLRATALREGRREGGREGGRERWVRCCLGGFVKIADNEGGA